MTDFIWRFSTKSSTSNIKFTRNIIKQLNQIFKDIKSRVKFASRLLIFLGVFLIIFSGLAAIQKPLNQAEATGFRGSWGSTINSISKVKTTAKVAAPNFSYQNPFLEYPNLNQAYLNDPDHTLKMVERVDQYIERNRSRDLYDTGVSSPVAAAFYYETAIKYNVPVDQMLAVARSESRFGTDCYSGSGNPTRICLYKNIFSIGLTQTSSLGFETWEKGVESFGRLYQSRKNRGFDDCQIWRIYNPNGDYCGKILTLASTINDYISQP